MANVALDNISATYSGAQFSELFLAPIFKDSSIMEHRVIPNVKHKMNLYTADPLSCIVKKYTGCSDGNESGGFNINDKVITAGRMRVAVSQCQAEFFGTFIEESFKNGVDVMNLEGTALMDTILQNVRNSIGQDVMKLAWWGDESASGDSAACYSSTNGWWNLLKANSDLATAKTTIANGALNDGDALTALRAMYAAAPSALAAVAVGEKAFYVSRSIYENYLASLEDLGNAEGFSQLVDGTPRCYFRGVEVIPMYSWDTAISQLSISDDNCAVYTAKNNLVVGTDTTDPEGELKMFYDDLTEKVYVRAYFKLGFQYLHNSMVQLGY